jgi:hypothetical protein
VLRIFRLSPLILARFETGRPGVGHPQDWRARADIAEVRLDPEAPAGESAMKSAM